MIGISADFDPVHMGHVKLIDKARELADKKDDEVVIYLNKGYSANHAPFFVNYEARSKMALDAGADRIVPIEGLASQTDSGLHRTYENSHDDRRWCC